VAWRVRTIPAGDAISLKHESPERMMTELRSLPYWRRSQFRAAISARNSTAVARVIHIAVKCKAVHIAALPFRFTVTTTFRRKTFSPQRGSHAISGQSI
jgi:hypothetical protein